MGKGNFTFCTDRNAKGDATDCVKEQQDEQKEEKEESGQKREKREARAHEFIPLGGV